MRGRLPGHTLKAEGAAYKYVKPFLAAGEKGGWKYDFAGDGHGMCECGWVSELLPSNNKRKAAHRDHKTDELAKLAKLDWNPAKVERALDIFGIDVTAFWSKTNDIRVTMSFRDLCSFAEAICGSMSEADLDDLVAGHLLRLIQAVEPSGRKQTD